MVDRISAVKNFSSFNQPVEKGFEDRQYECTVAESSHGIVASRLILDMLSFDFVNEFNLQ